ncbi:MAG: hypothetical protein IKZ36_02075, partial [Kiritimatiellae bacterium]|nr:hypothetical protein [Kiritimatiellia bacterium]
MGALAKVRVWGVPGIKDYFARSIFWWRMSFRFWRMAQKDQNVVPVRGITLIGDFANGSSNSKTNRDFAHALKDAGI